MKFRLFLLVATFLVTGCASTNQLEPVSQIEPSVAGEGSLANQSLIADAISRIHSLLGEGSTKADTKILKFVIQQPVGTPGERAWRELWIVEPEGAAKRFLMTFREAGLGAADFDIEPMS